MASRMAPTAALKSPASSAFASLSPRSVDHCRALLRNALSHPMRHSLIGQNVASVADPTPITAREFQALTHDAARRILLAIEGDRLEALFTVALAVGLRQSEALGLRGSDINVDAGTLSVQRTLQRVNGAFSFYPPKTPRSRRTIAFPAPVATALLQHLKRQLEEREALGPAWEGDISGALVFADEMGRPLTSFHVSRRFNKLLSLLSSIMIGDTLE